MEKHLPELPDQDEAMTATGDQVAEATSTQPASDPPGDLSTSGDDDYVPA